MSSKPRQGSSAALDEPLGLTATAVDGAAAKLKSRQGVRLPNASESQTFVNWRCPNVSTQRFQLASRPEGRKKVVFFESDGPMSIFTTAERQGTP